MDKIALTLVIVGALNWLLVGLFQFDLVAAIFGGQQSLLSRIVYSLVGIAGLWSIKMLFSNPLSVSQPAMKHMESNEGDKKDQQYSGLAVVSLFLVFWLAGAGLFFYFLSLIRSIEKATIIRDILQLLDHR